MIGESSGVSTLLNNERIYRESQVVNNQEELNEPAEIETGGNQDEVSLSAEAIALAQAVTPATENAEPTPVEPQGRGQGEDEAATSRFLDIRA